MSGRWLAVLLAVAAIGVLAWTVGPSAARTALPSTPVDELVPAPGGDAAAALAALPVKGRAPKTGYSRAQFGEKWKDTDRNGCDQRNDVLARDLVDEKLRDGRCVVLSGILTDAYTGTTVPFLRGQTTSDDVQIDHVVALSAAWQTGAQQLTAAERELLANEPLNLQAVEGAINQAKGDSDAASWLPPAKTYRCTYVARQIAVKTRYQLWVTTAERDAMTTALDSCPDQPLPIAIANAEA